ncbi:methionyl-tRNA formyltransferase [Candidatus Wolfebacteria bacterium]|nr:methionyl-tRNA formyltransferase [Candidatus Wolfebacteria bacterium]
MKYIFFGSPEFAAIILEKLINSGFIPSAVVCNPDKPVGRKKIITAPATKIIAQKYDIPVWQSEKLNLQNIYTKCDRIDCIYQKDFDFFIVAAYAKIISKEILEIPRLGTIGAHPSLLPKYRGATPIQSAILNNEKETGAAIFLIDEKVDHGRIVASSKYKVLSADDYESLMRKLAELSADLLIEILPNIEERIKTATIQDESQATYTKKFKTEDALISSEDLEVAKNQGGEIAIKIERKIKAFNPEPGAYTFINNKRVKLLEAEIFEGKLKLKKIQIEGEKLKTI